MNRDRFVLSDEVWLRIEPLLVGKSDDRGATGANNRLFMEALLWRERTGYPWRGLPRNFGNWNSTFRRFRRGADAGIFESLFKSLSGTPDFEYAMIDGTIVSSTRRQRVQKGTLRQAIGRSRGGLTTKIIALLDALGNLVRFVLRPGQAHDLRGVKPLIEGLSIGALLGSKRLT